MMALTGVRTLELEKVVHIHHRINHRELPQVHRAIHCDLLSPQRSRRSALRQRDGLFVRRF